jgi:hypothetical protein
VKILDRLRRREERNAVEDGHVKKDELDMRVEEEKRTRRKLNARLNSIEIEYGLDIKPTKLKEVN